MRDGFLNVITTTGGYGSLRPQGRQIRTALYAVVPAGGARWS